MDANLIRLIGSTAQHFRIMKGARQLLWGSVIYRMIIIIYFSDRKTVNLCSAWKYTFLKYCL